MDATDIDRLLTSSLHGASIAEQLQREAPEPELLAALQRTTDVNTWQLLHYVIGERKIRAAVPLLLEHLRNPDADIRDSAADALGKIGDPQAGEALFMRFTRGEPEPGVRQMLAVALGGVGYRPAIPVLIETLGVTGFAEAKGLRQMATEALRTLKAVEALPALEQASTHESDDYVRYRMQVAIDTLRQVHSVNRQV